MAECEFTHPHDHPCGRRVIEGVTVCPHCGRPDGDPACQCWRPATEADLDALYAEAWGIQFDGSVAGREDP
jgi:hypothetical protein